MLTSATEAKTLFGPVLSASYKHFHGETRAKIIERSKIGVEYTPRPEDFHILSRLLRPWHENGTKIRFHGFFPAYEIAHTDTDHATQAVSLHLRCLNAIQGMGEPFVTFHSGLNRAFPIDRKRLSDNLKRLVEHARMMGLTVCIENLKTGLTSDPHALMALSLQTGARITLDIGHAVVSDAVRRGQFSVIDMIDLFGDRLAEVHFYEKELDRHYAPKDLSFLGPIMDRLVTAKCNWWTIELDDNQDLIHTLSLIRSHFTMLVE